MNIEDAKRIYFENRAKVKKASIKSIHSEISKAIIVNKNYLLIKGNLFETINDLKLTEEIVSHLKKEGFNAEAKRKYSRQPSTYLEPYEEIEISLSNVYR